MEQREARCTHGRCYRTEGGRLGACVGRIVIGGMHLTEGVGIRSGVGCE